MSSHGGLTAKFLLVHLQYIHLAMLLCRKLLLSGAIIFVLLCLSLVPCARAVSMWSRTYGGAGSELAYSLIATSDGGYAIAGYTTSFGAGSYDFWLVKTDENGIVPEYSSWLIPALVLTATAFIIINKKKLLHKR